MHRNIKIKLKVILCVLSAVFGLSFVNLPNAFADSSYFDVEGSVLYLDSLFPGEDPEITVTVKATRAMKLYGMEMHFTPTHPNEPPTLGDEDLTLRWLNTEHPQMNGNESSLYTGLLTWNIEGDDTWDDRDYIDVAPGDVLFEAEYLLESDATSLSRDLPFTIDVAYIGDENGITETLRDITFPVKVYVVSGGNPKILSVHKVVEGNGAILAPNVISEGENLHVDFVPDEGYELRHAYINGYYLEEEELKNNSFDTIAIDNGYPYYEISVSFWPVYEVVEGNKGKYVAGSGKDFSFKINADSDIIDSIGNASVDDVWLSADDAWTVDPESGTISLTSDFLATLGLGEHSFELLTYYPEMGVARATFTVVEAEADEILPVPNAGMFTGNGNGARASVELTVIVAILISAVIVLLSKLGSKSKK